MQVPYWSVGTRAEVLNSVKKWIRNGLDVPVEMVELENPLIARSDERQMDLLPGTNCRLVLFETAILASEKFAMSASGIISRILDSNQDPWWGPYLLTHINVPIYANVSERLVSVCFRRWAETMAFGDVFAAGFKPGTCADASHPAASILDIRNGQLVRPA